MWGRGYSDFDLPSLVTGQLTVQWNLDSTNLYLMNILGITNDFLQLSQNCKKMYGKNLNIMNLVLM